MRLVVALPDCELIGVLGKGVETVRDGGSRRFVTRGDEENKEARQLLLCELLILNLGVNKRTGDVVNRIIGAELAEFLHDAGQGGTRLKERNDGVGALRNDVRVPHRQDDVAALQGSVVLARWNTHHVADDLQGEGCRDVADEVTGAVLRRTVQNFYCDAINGVFDCFYVARVKGIRHDATESSVLGVVR